MFENAYYLTVIKWIMEVGDDTLILTNLNKYPVFLEQAIKNCSEILSL